MIDKPEIHLRGTPPLSHKHVTWYRIISYPDPWRNAQAQKLQFMFVLHKIELQQVGNATAHISLTNWHWLALDLLQDLTGVRLQYTSAFISHHFLTSVL